VSGVCFLKNGYGQNRATKVGGNKIISFKLISINNKFEYLKKKASSMLITGRGGFVSSGTKQLFSSVAKISGASFLINYTLLN
jgi:hypothetical protein